MRTYSIVYRKFNYKGFDTKCVNFSIISEFQKVVKVGQSSCVTSPNNISCNHRTSIQEPRTSLQSWGPAQCPGLLPSHSLPSGMAPPSVSLRL